ncbi:hypothetical protein K437DRAFT_296306 [Tilletiaria anomala UBC 951]|uniref:Uncharacterized protein n=1 Tax=Tilletiaria anomala (strain ATCC 24038 / CBS 436.72 / UBC 951) TaxID=1037660 RepID=A0A066V9Y5_TILAU|nr:uncharacterized protein K437DRAFT_296306 [Tilletiaria anomala UBC 951]KDN38562.1 hypothetical protein K437DRAFT_296306 [Tilletiaria anomala UBC 951]
MKLQVVSKQHAESLASFSGMPFGQNGAGTALTAGSVMTAPPADLQLDPDSSSNNISLGAIVKFRSNRGSAMTQANVQVRTASTSRVASTLSGATAVTRGKLGAATAGPKVMASRATVSFPQLASSEAFVARLCSDIDALLGDFERKWATVVQGEEHAERMGFTECFEGVWIQNGWNFAHVAAGEDPLTRKRFFDVITRSFLERVHTILSSEIRTQDLLSQSDILHASAAFLALYIFWATCPPSIDSTITTLLEPPSLSVSSGHDQELDANVDARIWKDRIGQGWKIQIEADILSELERLPQLARAVAPHRTRRGRLGEAAAQQPFSPKRGQTRQLEFSPTAELRAVLDVMRGGDPKVDRDTQQKRTGAWYILPPTSFRTRVPSHLPDNKLLTQAQADRESRQWATLVVDRDARRHDSFSATGGQHREILPRSDQDEEHRESQDEALLSNKRRRIGMITGGTGSNVKGLSRSELIRATVAEHLFNSSFWPSAGLSSPLSPAPACVSRVALAGAPEMEKRFKGVGSMRMPSTEPMLASSFLESAESLVLRPDGMAELARSKLGPERASGVKDVMLFLDKMREEQPQIATTPAPHGLEEDGISAFLQAARRVYNDE